MTIHNFPEGIAVGFAFAVAYTGIVNPEMLLFRSIVP